MRRPTCGAPGPAPNPATRWLRYDFPTPVRVDRASIDFWSDSTTGGAGVAVPRSWTLQYLNGTTWTDVTGATGFDPAVPGSTNQVSFDAVTTTALRATFHALPDAAGTAWSAVGVSEWRVFAVGYNDGSRPSGIAVTWDPVDPARYAAPGTFEVSGRVAGTDRPATATVTVGTG